MNLTVYLPDELGRRAKEAELPFSRLLRDAVSEELQRAAELERLNEGSEAEMKTYKLKVGKGDKLWLARFKGIRIAATDNLDIYRTENSEIVLYNCHDRRFNIIPVGLDIEISEFLKEIAPSEDEYVQIASKLGLIAIVDV